MTLTNNNQSDNLLSELDEDHDGYLNIYEMTKLL
jgi:Ca2+-binding EF-hand superfamily protein